MKFASLFKKSDPNLKFVFDDDLVNYLKSIGVYEALTRGKIKCAVCSDTGRVFQI